MISRKDDFMDEKCMKVHGSRFVRVAVINGGGWGHPCAFSPVSGSTLSSTSETEAKESSGGTAVSVSTSSHFSTL